MSAGQAELIADALSVDERNALTLGFRSGLMDYASHSLRHVVLTLAHDHGLSLYDKRPSGGCFKSCGVWWLPLSDKGLEVAEILRQRALRLRQLNARTSRNTEGQPPK